MALYVLCAIWPISLPFLKSLYLLLNLFALYPISLPFSQSLYPLFNLFALYPISLPFSQSLYPLFNLFALNPISLPFSQTLYSTAWSRTFYRTPAGYTAKKKTKRKRNRGYQGLLSVAHQPLLPSPLFPHTARLLHCLGLRYQDWLRGGPPPLSIVHPPWPKICDFQERRLKRRTASI